MLVADQCLLDAMMIRIIFDSSRSVPSIQSIEGNVVDALEGFMFLLGPSVSHT